MSAITFKAVTKIFGKTLVVQDFSSVFYDHEFVTLLGPSGCGKTTLLRLIAGFEKPTSGEICLDDQVVSSPSHFVPVNERGIGMVFQSYAVWPHMTVFDNIAYPLKIGGRVKAEIKDAVEKALQSMHLEAYAQRYPHELSGGQQQRVALGRALVSKPRLLLLDEPLSNLDAKLRESMRFEIKEMQKQSGVTVVYVTHDQTEAMAMSDRVVVLNKGQIQQIDTPQNIYRHPVNQFVADFVGKINFLRGRVQKDHLILSTGQSLSYQGDKQGAVVLGVRPENITLRPDHGMLKGYLKQIYYLGDILDCRISFEVEDKREELLRVSAPISSYEELKKCSSIWLDLDEYLVFEDDGVDYTKILS